MVFGFTTYVDPGVYQQEVIVPTGVNIPAQPFAVCLVGTGSRNKRVTNEAVLRGVVRAETITPNVSSPHIVALANRADKKLENTTLYKVLNGITQVVPDSYVSFDAAYVLGTVTGTVDLSSNNALAMELDGKEALTLVVHDVPAVLTGNLVFAQSGSISTLTRGSGSFLTDGVRVGASVTIMGAEEAGNDGTFIVTSVTALAITFTNALGVANVDDDAASVTFSGTGFVGREIHVLYDVLSISAVTMTELAAAINQGFAAAGSLGYGAAYANIASVSSSALKITSPLSTPTSDVRVFDPFALSAVTAVFGASAAGNRDAQSYIHVSDLIWHASATWKVDYVKLVGDTDPLAQTTNVQSLVAVGGAPGSTNFAQAVDWTLTSNKVDWSPDAAAVVHGIAGTVDSAPNKGFNLGANLNLVLGLDGMVSTISGVTDITIVLSGMTAPPVGYADVASATNAKASELANNINAVLASALGPRYKAVASVETVNGTNRLLLTSPVEGQASSSIYVKAASSTSAHTTLFGGAVSNTLGTGKRPAVGSVYFVSYEYTRPTSEYDVPYRHFSVDAAMAQVGAPSPSTPGYNPLAVAAQIAFDNGAQYIYTCQVNDQTAEGNPTRAQVKSALDGAGTISGTTEIIVVGEPGNRLDVTADMMDHLETQCGPTEKHYRRLFCGMANGTSIGDRDTPDSMVGRATRTLQVAPTSPGRGRMFMVVPPQQAGVTRNVVFEDGSEARVALDATYLAVAVAARRTSLQGPAETLTRRTITGFNTDDITTPWKPAERRALAGQGCLVITYDAGRFIMLDALSTEGGGGGLEAFKVDSTSYQKDTIVSKINQALDANIVGIVPFDLASFILDIKLVIQGVIANEISKGTIGPYREKDTGAIRPIDLRVDIRVAQNVNVPTDFNFAYWFNLRYPALRLLGEYSVDNPFFALAA